ncbi:hypothetical protein DL95DRAFT_486971 [Leptodontidium sp. 2 PMI_412]|nr:hypothetical protein DL95DRAFT_486971 [Leptodontidium sp. 2 PMI_412]
MALTYLETKYNFALLQRWEEEEKARIASLSDLDLIAEVALVMSGRSYSWSSIAKRLLNVGIIDFFYCRKWNALCERKREWDTMAIQAGYASNDSSPNSFDESAIILDYLTRSQLWNTRGFRELLLDLKRVPIYAGLGTDGFDLVTSNVDENKQSRIDETLGLSELTLQADGEDEDTEPLLCSKDESFRRRLIDLCRNLF